MENRSDVAILWITETYTYDQSSDDIEHYDLDFVKAKSELCQCYALFSDWLYVQQLSELEVVIWIKWKNSLMTIQLYITSHLLHYFCVMQMVKSDYYIVNILLDEVLNAHLALNDMTSLIIAVQSSRSTDKRHG